MRASLVAALAKGGGHRKSGGGGALSCGAARTYYTPVCLSATIPAAGTSVTVVFDQQVTGSGAGFVLTSTGQGAQTLTYVSGSPGDTWVFSIPVTIVTGDPCTLAYTPGTMANGPVPLAAFDGKAVVNNSAQ